MSLKDQFPNTYLQLNKLEDAESVFSHILDLESGWENRHDKQVLESEIGTSDDRCDVFLAGGGLSLLYALVLAKAGYKVMVADRRRVGTAHREWNISYNELNAFVDAGIFSATELDGLINLRYDRGIVKWFGGIEHSVTGVLDCAIDAQKLLDKLRLLAEFLNVEILDYYSLEGYTNCPSEVKVALRDSSGKTRVVSTRLILDGRGSQSANGQFDIVCPTVGGIVSGFDLGTAENEVNLKVGEILVTREGIEDRKQHIWEGFPTNNNRLITYLFYYSHANNLGKHPLFSLYERFFSKLDSYKTGLPVVDKATYGFIPGNTRLAKCLLSPENRVYLVGDASGQHSPLTFCGFGSIVRSFDQIAKKLIKCLEEDKLDSKSLNALHCEMNGLKVMGGLAIMMIADRLPSSGDRQTINALLDDAFSILSDRGESMYRDFMQDKIAFSDFVPFMLEVAKKRPEVWQEVYARMSHQELRKYLAQLVTFGLADLKH